MTKIIAILSFLTLAGVGCIQFQGGGQAARDGGLWRTTDRGKHWEQKVAAPTPAGVGSIGGANIFDIVVDPQDPKALYLASDSGLIYSFDGGDSWQIQKQLASGRVNFISVDAKDKCTIYVAQGQRVWKSTDCNRSYAPVYFEQRAEQGMSSVAVDWFNPNIVYAGTTAGDLLKSVDGGASWTAIKRFEDRLKLLLVDPQDSRTVYVGLSDRGIWKTPDGGSNWIDLTPGLVNFGSGQGLVTIERNPVERGLLVIATRYGVLRSADGGTTWEALNLPTPPGAVQIFSLATNPKKANEIYYGTTSTFYKTLNGGANWSTEKLPTSRGATALLVDPENADMIYMGVTLFKK